MKCPSCNHEWKHVYGRRSSISEVDFREAIRKTNGNISAAARLLGIKIVTAQARARALKVKAMGRKGPFISINTNALMDSFRSGASIPEIAKEYEISTGTVYNRLRDVAEYRELRSRSWQRKIHNRKMEIAKALVESNGNMAGAAVILGISRERVRQLWNTSKDLP